MEKKKIIISIPHNNDMVMPLAKFLASVKPHPDYETRVRTQYRHPVDGNRNLMIKKFLQEDEDNEWLLFVDADTVPPLNVFDMINHNESIVGGLVCGMAHGVPYPLIMRSGKKDGYRMIKPAEEEMDSGNGLIEVDGAGAATLLIRREVLERMNPPWFKFDYDEWGVSQMSEDYAFSRQAKSLGYKMWIDPNIQCMHLKQVDLLWINQLVSKAILADPKTPMTKIKTAKSKFIEGDDEIKSMKEYGQKIDKKWRFD